MKEKDASIEQWATLVKVTQNIAAKEPWKQFEDMEIFALKLQSEEELIYASIMGFHQMCYGLTFYRGEEGFKDISTIAYEIDDRRFENYITMESAFLSVYFDDQKNVSYQQRQIYEKLGLPVNAYPHFTVKEKGCFPDDPDSKEVENYILFIAALSEAIEYFLQQEIIIDFTKEMFVYDTVSKTGENKELILTPREFMPVICDDEQFLDKLKEMPCNNEIWEMEFNYINQGMERDDGRLLNVRFSMVANKTEEDMLACIPLEENCDEIEVVMDSLFQLIEQHGRPATIGINNVRLLTLIGPSCDYLGIDIDEEDDLTIIDTFLSGFYEFASKQSMA